MAKKMNESFNDLFPDLVGSTPPAAKRARLSTGRQGSASKSRYRPLRFEFKAPAARQRGPLETLLTPENNVLNRVDRDQGRFKEPPPPRPPPPKERTVTPPSADPMDDADDWGDDNDDALLVAATQMMEDKKPETGITDEELMRLTMALNDDDFNLEEDFQDTELNPSKARLNQSMAVFAPLDDEDFFERAPEPDQLVAQLRSETRTLRDETDRLKTDFQQTKGEVLFLRDKLEAKSRELEKERAAKRHLASDLNRELDKMARQKEADVQAVRSEMQFLQLELTKAQERQRRSAAPPADLNTTTSSANNRRRNMEAVVRPILQQMSDGTGTSSSPSRPPQNQIKQEARTDAEPEEKKEASPVVKDEKVKKVGRWRLKLGTTIPNLLIEAFCTVTRTDPGPQASLLIRTRQGGDVRPDWVRLLDMAAANIRRLLPATGIPAGTTVVTGTPAATTTATSTPAATTTATSTPAATTTATSTPAATTTATHVAGDITNIQSQPSQDTVRDRATKPACLAAEDLNLVERELENMGELIEMSGEAFRSREMEIILETGLTTLHYTQATGDWRLVGGVVSLVGILWEYEAPDAASLTTFLRPLQEILRMAVEPGTAPLSCSSRRSLLALVLVLARSPALLPLFCTMSENCLLQNILDEFYTSCQRTKIVHDVKYVESECDHQEEEEEPALLKTGGQEEVVEDISGNQARLLRGTKNILSFVERSILVLVGGCPWTDSSCLPCTTTIVRCLVVSLYSLIRIYMDRLSTGSSSIETEKNVERRVRMEEDSSLTDLRKLMGECLQTLVRLKLEVGGGRDWELWIRVVDEILSENKKKFVWSLASLPVILGQQYTSQLRELDMAV